MIRLSKEQIKNLHTKLIQATGGLDGIRDEGFIRFCCVSSISVFWG